MRAAVLLAIIAAFVPHPASSYGVRHESIPIRLHGTWAATDEDCRNAQKSMTISDNTYVDPDKRCSVFWVSENAAVHGSIYSAHMQCSASPAGSTKSIDDLLLVPKDANHLAMGPDFNRLKVLQRCPAR